MQDHTDSTSTHRWHLLLPGTPSELPSSRVDLSTKRLLNCVLFTLNQVVYFCSFHMISHSFAESLSIIVSIRQIHSAIKHIAFKDWMQTTALSNSWVNWVPGSPPLSHRALSSAHADHQSFISFICPFKELPPVNLPLGVNGCKWTLRSLRSISVNQERPCCTPIKFLESPHGPTSHREATTSSKSKPCRFKRQVRRD